MGSAGKVRTPLGQRLRRARVGALPTLIWVGSAALAVELWVAGPVPATYHGLARETRHEVTAGIDGALTRLHVEVFSTVRMGDPLATFDSEPLEAAIRTADAELRRLEADLIAERARIAAEEQALRQEWAMRHGLAESTVSLEFPAEVRAFHADETGLELDLLRNRLALTSSELEADRLEVQVRRARGLASERFAPEADAVDLEKALAQERARALDLRAVEAGLVVSLEEARARRRALEESYRPPAAPTHLASDPEARLAGLRAATAVQACRLDELALRRKHLLCRAPSSGTVAEVSASAGQTVVAGQPLIVLTVSEPEEVDLWISEWSPSHPRLGDRFTMSRAASPASAPPTEGVVSAMGPGLELMPQRLWRDVRAPEYGRVYLVRPVTKLELVPGERLALDPVGESSVASR